MSEEIKEEISSDTVIVTDNAEKVKNPLDIDVSKLTNKELNKFDKADLLSIAKNLNALSDLKDWEITRLTKPKLVTAIKKAEKEKDSPKVGNEQNQLQEPNSENDINIPLLQIAVIDIFANGNTDNLDKFCTETVQNNDSGLVDQEQINKMKNVLVKFSMLHLIIKQFGGYKNLYSKGKEFYTNFKNRKTVKDGN